MADKVDGLKLVARALGLPDAVLDPKLRERAMAVEAVKLARTEDPFFGDLEWETAAKAVLPAVIASFHTSSLDAVLLGLPDDAGTEREKLYALFNQPLGQAATDGLVLPGDKITGFFAIGQQIADAVVDAVAKFVKQQPLADLSHPYA
jgi:hypothetical protein